MKIVCDSCSTKYSIADEKVRGKVFKIKCKKCGHIIVVKGAEPAAAAPAGDGAAQAFDQKETRVFDYSGFDPKEGGAAAPPADAVWHLVVEGDQVGPLTAADVHERFKRREIDGETYAWREGFADWQRLAAIDELRFIVAETDGATAVAGGPPPEAAESPASLFGGAAPAAQPSDLFAAAASPSGGEEGGGDLFGSGAGAGLAAAAPGDNGGPVFASTPPPGAGGASPDMFGGAAMASGGGGGGGGGGLEMAGEAAGPSADGGRMTGQRNENSVLFSLSNLAALATDAPASKGPVGPGPGFSPGGTTEGSGLIDIRAMAAMTLGGRKEDAGPRTGAEDDLPVFSPASFATPAAGVLLPTAAPSSRQNKILYGLIGAVGLLAIVAIVLVIFVVKGSSKPAGGGANDLAAVGPEKIGGQTPGKTTGAPDKGGTPSTPGGDSPASPGAGGDDGSAAGGATPPPGDTTPDKSDSSDKSDKGDRTPGRTPSRTDRRTDRTPSKTDRTPTKTDRTPAPDPTPSPAAGGGGGKCDEVACLVEWKPCCGGSRPGGGGSSRSSGGSGSANCEKLERGDVQSGINTVRGRVMACNDKYRVAGTVSVKIAISAGGSVSRATVTGKFAGTPTGSCVESAVKQAKFKASCSGLTVNYPFAFR